MVAATRNPKVRLAAFGKATPGYQRPSARYSPGEFVLALPLRNLVRSPSTGSAHTLSVHSVLPPATSKSPHGLVTFAYAPSGMLNAPASKPKFAVPPAHGGAPMYGV
jgi:hypothetical protein